MYLYCCCRLQGGIIRNQRGRTPRRLCVCCARFERTGSPTREILSRYRPVMPENQPMTTHTSVHHSLLISNSLLSLYRLTFPVLSRLPTTALQQPEKTQKESHRADNTWHNTAVITGRSGDIFPDRSRNAIVKFVHRQFCQPVIDRRVEGFLLRRGKFITCVGNHFFQCLPG